MEPVAVLFVRADSVYKTMPGVDAWDEARDARRWPGGSPLVAHPPCRMWGRYAQRAKGTAAEKQLALDAVAHVRRFGGALEHPASSKLIAAAGLPQPGQRDEFGGWTLLVFQSWWGHRAPKPTIVYIVGIEPADLPPIPYALGIPPGRIENMGRAEREATPAPFCEWLVEVARRCVRPLALAA